MKEKDLIARSKKGDEHAFNTLFLLYHTKIYSLCLGIVKDQELAEDLTQETFLQAYKHLATFREKSSFYTWIYRIAHNLSLNQLKKKEHRKEYELKEEIFRVHSAPSIVETKEFKESLDLALATLSEKHRLVYVLCEIEKKPQKEVAALLNIPAGTIRSRLFYARKQIKSYFMESSK